LEGWFEAQPEFISRNDCLLAVSLVSSNQLTLWPLSL
jgi:hypothetical protein